MANTHSFSRAFGCRVSDALTYTGQALVVLENAGLRVAIMPGKGAEIIGLLHKPTDTDPLFRRGPFRPPAPYPATFPDPGGAFLDSYSGGWQELFPSGGGPCQVQGAVLGSHGEALQLPWHWEVLEDRPERVAVRFWVELLRTPFRLERIMRLDGAEPVFSIEERATNTGGEPAPCMWGHHPALGAPFLDDSCVLDAPAAAVEVQAGSHSPSDRLTPGSRGTWPVMIGAGGDEVDLRCIPGPERRSHDMFYLTGLKAGWCALTNRRRGLGFGLTWGLEPFSCLWVWQEFCGSSGYPWYSQAYALGLEPFSAYAPGLETGLAAVVRSGQARWLAPGENLQAHLKALFYPAAGAQGVQGISPGGEVELY